MKKNIKIYLGILITIVLSLLIVHTFSICSLKVDNISISLLVFLILIPLITGIKKFKWGEFEAEIETKEVRKIKKSVDNTVSNIKESKPHTLSSKSINNYSEEECLELIDYLIDLAELDPVLAIAKLRFELEKLIRGIYLAHNGDEKRSHNIGYMTKYLMNKDDFKSQELESAELIINVSNRVIHGEKIDNADVKTLIYSAVKLLGYMTGYTKALDLQGLLK